VELALAKAVESIPDAGVLPGGNVYEMKWDGFRAVCVVDVDGVSLWSRQRKDLNRLSVGRGRFRADLSLSETAIYQCATGVAHCAVGKGRILTNDAKPTESAVDLWDVRRAQ
jgi:hypothetical protein